MSLNKYVRKIVMLESITAEYDIIERQLTDILSDNDGLMSIKDLIDKWHINNPDTLQHEIIVEKKINSVIEHMIKNGKIELGEDEDGNETIISFPKGIGKQEEQYIQPEVQP